MKAVSEAAARRGNAAQRVMQVMATKMQTAVEETDGNSVTSGQVRALRADVCGRMTKAMQGMQRFNRWGKHYLRALTRSHQLQMCTNFMDTGLQLYGGELFKSLRSRGDTIFLELPPPVPTRRAAPAYQLTPTRSAAAAAPTASSRVTGAAAAAAAPPDPPDMRTYYAGSGGGCFGAGCTVSVLGTDGRTLQKTVGSVKRGDEVLVAGGGTATVRCVVRVHRSAQKNLVSLPGSGLQITARHPVRVDGVWILPGQMPDGKLAPTGASSCVYNLVLSHSHVLLVNGVECVTWGHGMRDAVVAHPYFGSDHVLADLAGMAGWESGFVRVQGCIKDQNDEVVALCEAAALQHEASSPAVTCGFADGCRFFFWTPEGMAKPDWGGALIPTSPAWMDSWTNQFGCAMTHA